MRTFRVCLGHLYPSGFLKVFLLFCVYNFKRALMRLDMWKDIWRRALTKSVPACTKERWWGAAGTSLTYTRCVVNIGISPKLFLSWCMRAVRTLLFYEGSDIPATKEICYMWAGSKSGTREREINREKGLFAILPYQTLHLRWGVCHFGGVSNGIQFK